jgi:hypothetical protein
VQLHFPASTTHLHFLAMIGPGALSVRHQVSVGVAAHSKSRPRISLVMQSLSPFLPGGMITRRDPDGSESERSLCKAAIALQICAQAIQQDLTDGSFNSKESRHKALLRPPCPCFGTPAALPGGHFMLKLHAHRAVYGDGGPDSELSASLPVLRAFGYHSANMGPSMGSVKVGSKQCASSLLLNFCSWHPDGQNIVSSGKY